MSNGAATLAWDSIPGWRYEVYRTTNLVNAAWLPVLSITALTNRSLFTDPNLLPTAFYYLDAQ